MISFHSTRLLGVLAGTTLAWVPAQRDPSVLNRPPAVAVQTAPASVTLEPPSGPPGTPVMVKGTGLSGTIKVLFSPAVEADFTVVDETTVQATVPPGATSGPVQVVTPKGTLKSMEPFQVPAT